MLEGLKRPEHQKFCKVVTIERSLPDADKKIFMDLIQDNSWPVSTLETALRSRGVQISESPIRKHRLKMCSCFR